MANNISITQQDMEIRIELKFEVESSLSYTETKERMIEEISDVIPGIFADGEIIVKEWGTEWEME